MEDCTLSCTPGSHRAGAAACTQRRSRTRGRRWARRARSPNAPATLVDVADRGRRGRGALAGRAPRGDRGRHGRDVRARCAVRLPWVVAELAWWRRQGGIDEPVPGRRGRPVRAAAPRRLARRRRRHGGPPAAPTRRHSRWRSPGTRPRSGTRSTSSSGWEPGPRRPSSRAACGARRAWGAAWAAAGDEGKSGEPHAARGRGARARRPRSPKRRGGRAAGAVRANRGSPRLVDPAQAGRSRPRGGHGRSHPPRASPADVGSGAAQLGQTPADAGLPPAARRVEA